MRLSYTCVHSTRVCKKDIFYCCQPRCVSYASASSRIIVRTIDRANDKKLTRAEWKVDTTGMTMPFLRSLKCQIPALHTAPARKLHERIAFPLSFKPESIAGYLWPVVDHYHSDIEHARTEWPLLFVVVTSLFVVNELCLLRITFKCDTRIINNLYCITLEIPITALHEKLRIRN